MKFTPEAAIFTTASLGLGSGTGKFASSKTSGPPFRFTRIAFMFPFDSWDAMEVSEWKVQKLSWPQTEVRPDAVVAAAQVAEVIFRPVPKVTWTNRDAD